MKYTGTVMLILGAIIQQTVIEPGWRMLVVALGTSVMIAGVHLFWGIPKCKSY